VFRGLLRGKHGLLGLVALLLFASTFLVIHAHSASAAACTAPSTDYGNVTGLSVTLPATTTYRVWTRMAAPDTTNNTYLLEIDGANCYTVGGSTVPTYTNGTSTYFVNNTTNWISKTSSGTQIDVSLTAGAHTLKLIGNAAGVVVDRVILTQDTTCIPTGTGDNCANPPDTTPPVVSITSPANNASISTVTSVTANATDDVAVSKVEFYVDGVLKATDTTGPSYTYSLDPSTLSVGSHTLTAKAYDAANNNSSGSITFTVPDTTPPTISAISAGSITQNTATVSWTTNEASDTQVEYGTTISYGSATTLNASMVTSHSASISGLSASTTYHYRVKSKDAAGNLATSADGTFTTLAPAPDTTKPTVSITAPLNNATITTTTTVTATASDNVGVVGVQFLLDGSNLGSEDLSSPYSTSWNPIGVTNGTHVLAAVARDAAGNAQTTSITVTVSNPTYLPEDINQDGHVDLLDFSLLAAKFGQTGAGLGRADINGDNAVNLLDFSRLASKYGT